MTDIKKFLEYFRDGFLAGILIVIGCGIYLESSNKYVGAFLFSIALLTICYKNYNLYTGRIGFILEEPSIEKIQSLLIGLLGNSIACILVGSILCEGIPSIQQIAERVVIMKLEQTALSALARSFFCGILMYIAVSIYKKNKSIVGILFAIPVFILSGYEHSIADIGYFVIAKSWSLNGMVKIFIYLTGNTFGSLFMYILENKKIEEWRIEEALNE